MSSKLKQPSKLKIALSIFGRVPDESVQSAGVISGSSIIVDVCKVDCLLENDDTFGDFFRGSAAVLNLEISLSMQGYNLESSGYVESAGVDFTLPWNHALPPFACPPQPLILHQPVLLNKILVEFVGPAADGADVEREDVVALRSARNGEGVPLKFAYYWQVDEHPVPWLQAQ